MLFQEGEGLNSISAVICIVIEQPGGIIREPIGSGHPIDQVDMSLSGLLEISRFLKGLALLACVKGFEYVGIRSGVGLVLVLGG